MFRSLFLVLVLSAVCFGQQKEPQQQTIEQTKEEYQTLKDWNVQIAAKNNEAFTVMQQLLDYNASYQNLLKLKDDTIATFKKKEVKK